jgi:hypothetical protein
MPSGLWVTYVPYDPSHEMPDEGGPNECLTGTSIPHVSQAQPSTASAAFLLPSNDRNPIVVTSMLYWLGHTCGPIRLV